MKRIIFSLILLSSGWACNQSPKELNSNSKAYFSTSSFIETLISDSIQSVAKSIHINDLTETKEISHYNIKSDLEEFEQRDISHPKYQGKFISKIKTTPEFIEEIYTSTDNKLPIKQLRIIKTQDDKIIQVEIVERKETALIKQETTYSVKPNISYSKMACDSMALVGKKCKGYDVVYVKK